MKLHRAAVFVAGCASSLMWLAPLVGVFNYAVIGIVAGLMALVTASIMISRDHVPAMLNAGSSIVIGALCGLFWPVASSGTLFWLTFSKRAEAAPDA